MDKIKINFKAAPIYVDKNDNLITNILKEKFTVEISDEPDFLFVFPYAIFKEERYDFLKNDCIRILYTWEPYSVDFNFYDYAIGFDYMTMLDKNGKDRYFRFPHCFNRFYYNDSFDTDIIKKGMTYEQAKKILEEKTDFCSFIYSHKSFKGQREDLFDKLSSYKKVDSAGSYLNNMQDGFVAYYFQKKQKIDFVKKYKFDIACESLSFPGFTTEKIVDNFLCNTIPVYYGDPFVEKIFNEKAFINTNKLSLEETLLKVKELDTNDEKYIEMLMQPKINEPNIFSETYENLKNFLFYICSQSKEKAYRRQRCFSSQWHEDAILYYKDMTKKYKKTLHYIISRIIARIKRNFFRSSKKNKE